MENHSPSVSGGDSSKLIPIVVVATRNPEFLDKPLESWGFKIYTMELMREYISDLANQIDVMKYIGINPTQRICGKDLR